ncbi:MAG: AEC family transporter [Nitrospirae bacterium]|nr:AEC family transporter [Nitrospirota bacterium]
MRLFVSTFQAVALMFLIGGLGVYVISRKIVPSSALKMLSPLAIDIALPALASYNVLTKFKPEENLLWWMLPVYWAGFTVIAFILSLIFMNISLKVYRREFFTSLFYQNGIFFPLMILGGMYGTNSIHLVNLFLFTLFFPAFFHNTMPKVFKGHTKDNHNISLLLNPVFVATIFTLAVRLIGFNKYLPNFVLNGLMMVGGMSLPLLLLIIGANVHTEYHLSRVNAGNNIEWVEIIKFLITKNILFPLVMILLLRLVTLPHDIAFLILLQAAVPPITIVPIITERYGGNGSIVNQLLLFSFIFSLISIPVMVMLFGWYIGG